MRTDALLGGFVGTGFKRQIDRVTLWCANHVTASELTEDLAGDLCLPRLRDPSVLFGAVRDGMALLTWLAETFAFADRFDEDGGRCRGLLCGQPASLRDRDPAGFLVKGDIVRAQFDATAPPPLAPEPPGRAPQAGDGAKVREADGGDPQAPQGPLATPPKCFHGTVALDAARCGRKPTASPRR